MFEGITELDEAKIQVPMLIFQVEMLGLSSLSTLFFRRWVDAGERRKQEAQRETSDEDAKDTAAEKDVGTRPAEQDIPV